LTTWAVLALALIAAACGDDSPTSPSSAGFQVTELFSGTLPPRESRFQVFSVTDPSYVTATLASVTVGVPAVSTRLGVGFGTPIQTGTDTEETEDDGIECVPAESTVTGSGLVAQLSAYKAAGTYCVRVYDAGELTTTVGFNVRLVHF
jgi:hypothetical protein